MPTSGLLRFLCDPFAGMDKQVVALDAIAAGLGAMFPSPALAVVIMHELTLAAGLSIFSGSYIERVSTSMLGATVSWVIFNSFGGRKIIPGPSGDWGPVPGAATSWDLNLCLSHTAPRGKHCSALNGVGGGADTGTHSLSMLLSPPGSSDDEHLEHLGKAVLLGFASSAVGLVALLEMGLMRQVSLSFASRSSLLTCCNLW